MGIGNAQRRVERRGVGADVLMDLETPCSRSQHALQGLRATGRSARQHERVERRLLERGVDVAERPHGIRPEVPDGAVVLDDQRREARSKCLIADARTEEVHVGVNRTSGGNQALA